MTVDSLPVDHLFTITAATSPPAFIADGPQGTRLVIEARSGSFEGPKLKGTVLGPGGDWVTMRPDGTGKLDVRLLLQTEDGAMILMTYTGIMTEGAATIRTAPLFETGDERYRWLNAVQGVAHGRLSPEGVTYDVYALQ
jgi:hypothetical protein